MKKYFACVNPKCPIHFHELSDMEAVKVTLTGAPVVVSLNGEEPPLEAAIEMLEVTLNQFEDHPEIAGQVHEKLGMLRKQLDDQTCSCDACADEPTTSEGPDTREAISVGDKYYNSEEYFKVRHEMELANIRSMDANTELLSAKARKIQAEARILEAEAYMKERSLPTQVEAAKPTK